MTKTTNETRKRLRDMAAEVFGDTRTAKRWFADKNMFLNSKTPTEMIRTKAGAREVEDLLGRIKHGVYS